METAYEELKRVLHKWWTNLDLWTAKTDTRLQLVEDGVVAQQLEIREVKETVERAYISQNQKIQDLKDLLEAYRKGLIRERPN